MKIKKFASRKFLYFYATIFLVASVGLMVPFTMSLFTKEAESNGSYGEVSLRSYFERGTGDEDDPYVITRPRHLYNLSRLQGLGVFSEKKYFQLGLLGLDPARPLEKLCYLDDSSSTKVPFLDMSDSNFDYEPITAIGTEAVPFFGEFDGQGLEIKNLNVYADPEDAGLFGYTAHGSLVKQLFLDNVTIHARGYTSGYSGLYGTPCAAAANTSLTYSFEDDNDTFTLADTDKFKAGTFDASDIFAWDGVPENEPEITDPSPIIGFSTTNSAYRYKFLISGDFLTDIGNGQVKVDLPAVYKFFRKEKLDLINISYPLTATSSVSLVASMTDNYGLDHSKVIITLDFNFSLNSSTTDYLIMSAHLGEEHNNNIGLLIGHCDGSVDHCYVNKGAFDMNNGDASYNKMANGSNYGLIGLVGGTVHNFAAEESDAGTSVGKDIGVLDFTTVYNDIITPTSFSNSTNYPLGGVTYVPSSSKLYAEFLRSNNSTYVTHSANTVSFNRQKVITNSDLGIFTVATDQTGSGMDGDVGNELENSIVRSEDPSINSSYYIYYTTGEYTKANKTSLPFSKYRDGMQADTPEEFFPGLHFPNYDQISTKSFEQRDAHQNYIFRFKVDGSYRTGKGFYFSDVDKTSPGGSFLSHHFENKLVDKEGHPILASSDSKLSGIMLRNSLGQELRSFSASFATPDLSLAGKKIYCVNNSEFSYPAANMVNFSIKTNTANVTVIAGLTDISKPAALGVYKIDGVTRTTVGNNPPYLNGLTCDDPDYAFFMPADNHLAYFDYKVDENDVGKIGVYNSTGTVFTEATTNTEATIPSLYNTTEFGYSSGKTRLFAHTFKLEPGQYCIGSATGENRVNGTEGTAKIFYLCAQGQTDGNIEFSENTFASEDEVKNVDFTKVPRYTYENGVVTTNITSLDVITSYNANDGHIENQRLYVSFLTSERSLFDAAVSNIEFVYEDGKFKIKTTTLSAMLHIAVSNYAQNHQQVTGLTNTTVKLFNEDDSTSTRIVYPPE